MTVPIQFERSLQFGPAEWAGRTPAYASGGALRIPEGSPATLTDALLLRAEERQRGILYVQKEGSEEFQSYAQLITEARCVLSGLRAIGLKPGDRVILQIPDLKNHFTTFWACVLGGFTPVTVAVAPSYTEKNGVVSKLWNTWKLLKSPLIITSAHLQAAIQGVASLFEMPDLRTTAVEPLKRFDAADKIQSAQPQDLVFLQLTSGSTGVPKCIQETHRGIIHHIHGAQQFNGYTLNDVTLNWLPVDHVVPILTSHLKDVYLGCKQIHIKADIVLSEPLRWLDLIEKHSVTHTWSPNFGFKLVSDRLAQTPQRHWNLSSIKFMMNAGEQVTLPVVSDFLARTEPFGIRSEAMQPAFGMAEVCTCMTYQNNFSTETGVRRFKKSSLGALLQKADASDPAAVTFVDLGPPVPGVEIRITDKENKVVPEGVIGRFQIRGAVVTPGYLFNDAANQEAFVGDGWFNSGDLGFILEGRLTLTGREKEMIIVRGANFYCYEIEDVVNGVEGVEPTFVSSSAVADPNTGTEGLAILFVPKESQRPLEKLVPLLRQIKAKVAASLGINPLFVVPLEKAGFLKTTSGKIQRSQMKKNLEAGEYNSILQSVKTAAESPRAAAKDNIEEKLLAIWKELFKLGELGVVDNFFELGGDSLLASQVISRVQDSFQVDLPFHVLFNGGATIQGMAEHIRKSEARKSALPPIHRRAELSRAPASLGQQRLWLMDQLNPGCPTYNVATITRIRGLLNVGALERSLARLLARHEVLRTRFEVDGDLLWQVFDGPSIQVAEQEVSDSDFSTVLKKAQSEAAKPFDLGAGPLMRAVLFKAAPEERYLVLTIHQTVIDGWSLNILFQDLADIYKSEIGMASATFEPSAVDFGDYAAWQRAWLKGDLLEEQMSYWRKELAGATAEIDLPTDLPRPRIQSFLADSQSHRLPDELTTALREFAREQGVTVFMVLLAAYQAFLSRLTGQQEVIVGSAIAGRSRTELEEIIGFFANTVAMKATLLSNPTFAMLVARTREKTLAAYEHQYAPFEKIVQELRSGRAGDRSPIFQVWFGAWDALRSHDCGKVQLEPLKLFMPGAQFELSLFVVDAPQLELVWEYRTDLFLESTIARFRREFQTLLQKVLSDSETPLQTIFARVSEEDFQRQGQEQSRLRDGLRSARRKSVTLEVNVLPM
jgi:acyl-CoA synthetase (AMP-forming)/AMP-acid ligase II